MAVETAHACEDGGDDAPRPWDEQIVMWLNESDSHSRSGQQKYSPEDVNEFRPGLRPPSPVLTVLDDGSTEQGDDIQVRQETLRIGRTSGDVRIRNDWAISGAHAEIRRSSWKGGYQWHLHDLDSVNGTFVRCLRAILHDSAILIIGSRRFRLTNPLKPNTVSQVGRDTNPMDGVSIPATVWPVLQEASANPTALVCPLRSDRLVIGRTGGGADIELDDPLLAYRHAELKRMGDGTWIIVSETTRNGIWVSISAVGLSPNCYFRCGEQRFRFVIP